MKIGCTASYNQFEKIRQIAEAGYDYIETNLSALAAADDAQVSDFMKTLAECEIPCETANCLFSGNIRLTGKAFNGSVIEDYLDAAFKKAHSVGIKTVVFGSGGARRIPDGFDRDEAMGQLFDVCKYYLEPIAEKYDLYIAVENLNKNETNVFNRVSEIASFVDILSCERIKVLCDNYHMAIEGEDFSVIRKVGKSIIHTHIANPDRRNYPTVNDSYDYSEFFDSLKAIGYDGGITVEVGVPDDDRTEESIYAASIFLKTMI